MRRITLLLLPTLLGAMWLGTGPAHGSQAPAGVDNLTPDDVTKAVEAVKETFVRQEALTDPEMARATLQGLLDRLAPEVSLVTGTANVDRGSPFYSEAYGAKTGYLRLGDLTAENIAKAAQALKDWGTKGIGAVVLDLRGTPASSDFQAGANLARLFCAKGTEMFSLTAEKEPHPAPNSPPANAQVFTADAGPVFTGILVVLVDGDTAEAPEAVAASLRSCAKALVVGDRTAGRAFEYRDVPLQGAMLRVAEAQVILPDGKKPGDDGLKPDITVGLDGAAKRDVMRSISLKGVDSVIEEHDRPHLNEAALVAGSNPEVDELEAEGAGNKPAGQGVIDRQLQRALDLVTSITIYQGKSTGSAGSGE